MNTKKILAVAAVALMAVPAYAAATQIVLPGVTEQIVEGHTVFAVIEKARFRNVTIEAAAVAVLVRERNEQRENFKGVLWFNDQFLVSPYVSQSRGLRYPCGGAVIAVNSGDPDPRTMLVSYNQDDVYQERFNSTDDRYDQLAQEDSAYENPDPLVYEESGDYHRSLTSYITGASERDYNNGAAINDGGTPGSNGAPATPGAFQPKANSWLDYDATYNRVTSSTVTGVLNYVESYLITDPNDHTWIVDKYNGLSTVSVDLSVPGSVALTTSSFPLWVVNILGRPVFTPDNGISSCSPFTDDPWQQSRINSAFITGDGTVCGLTTSGTAIGTLLPDSCPSAAPGLGADPNGDGLPIDGLDAKPPAIGYYEPTDPATNGGASYCYDGNVRQGTNAGRGPGMGCSHTATQNPLRLYNAVLYFYLGPQDVYITGSAPHGATDTNGCESTPTYNGIHGPIPKPATEWLCPGGDDNAEGNSHPFNPPGIYVPTVWSPTSGTPVAGTGLYYDIWSFNRECSLGFETYPVLPLELEDDPATPGNEGKNYCKVWEHQEHNRGSIDLFFSPVARPLEPPVRDFVVLDYEGSIDEFHENNEPPPHPGTADFDPVPATYLADS